MSANLDDLYDKLNNRIYDLRKIECENCARCKLFLVGCCEFSFLKDIQSNLDEITKGIELLTRGKK